MSLTLSGGLRAKRNLPSPRVSGKKNWPPIAAQASRDGLGSHFIDQLTCCFTIRLGRASWVTPPHLSRQRISACVLVQQRNSSLSRATSLIQAEAAGWSLPSQGLRVDGFMLLAEKFPNRVVRVIYSTPRKRSRHL